MSNKVFLGTAGIATCLLLAMGELAAETRQETALSYIELGNKFMHQGDFDRAIGAYNIALQFAPDFAPAFFHRALAYEARGDVMKAITDYTNALDIASGFTTAWYNRGNLRLNGGDLDGALSDFNKAVESDRRYVMAYNNRGIAKNPKATRKAPWPTSMKPSGSIRIILKLTSTADYCGSSKE